MNRVILNVEPWVNNVVQTSEIYEGFILLIEYPGCNRKVGDFEKYTTGDFLNYPKIWKPVYTKKYMRDEKIETILDGK